MTDDSINAALTRVSRLLNSGQAQAAEQALDRLLALHPRQDELLYPRMLTHAQAGRFANAFAIALRLSENFKQDWRVSFQILNVIKGLTKIEVSTETEREICRLLAFPGLICLPISEVIYRLFIARAQECNQSHDAIARANLSPIINSALRHFWLRSAEIEPMVTRWRQKILSQCADSPETLDSTTQLAISIVKQSHRNDYAFFITPEEAAQLEILTVKLKAGGPNQPNTAAIILSLLMYVSPTALSEQLTGYQLPQPELDPAMLAFIGDDLQESTLLKRYTKEFAENMVTANDISNAVAKMYGENPYPRWLEPEANTNVEKLSYPAFYNLASSPAWVDPVNIDFTNMLVAGCGTGWHPISHAISFPWIKIVAIDLSPASLAYARLMAEKLGIDNLQLEQADILSLSDQFGEFDIIESVGTLHHLKDPDQGLRHLLSHLRPGGVFRLGCYSRIARHSIIKFRDNFKPASEVLDRAYIRDLRQRFYVDESFAPFRGVMEFGDFFSISGCRDLLLHPQETQYSIPDLQHILKANALDFLTFSPVDIERFELLETAGSLYELAAWQAAEEKEPRLFANMYQFFTQYRGHTGSLDS